MFPAILIDIILTVIIIFFVILGLKRGLIRSCAKPIRILATFLTAYWLANPISTYIIEPMVRTPITSQIKGYLIENCPNLTPLSAKDELPTLLKLAASAMDIDVSALSAENIISEIVDTLANPAVHFICVIITFILLFFVCKIGYSILLAFVASFFDGGIIGKSNKILGLVFGLLEAFLVCWLFSVIFDFFIHISIFENVKWMSEFRGGWLYRFFNMMNPVDLLLSF